MADFDTPVFPLLEPLNLMEWDMSMDQQMVTSYSQLFQSPLDFYTSMDYFTATSPSSNGSPLLDASTTTLVGIAKTQGTVPCSLKAERRRGQNRQAQRAYRDRKEKRRHELEDQIAVWKQKNEKLVQSCASQTEKVLQLNALIEDLNAQLEVTSQQSGFTEMWNDVDQFQQGFNLVPLHDKTPGSCSRGDDES